MLLLKDKAVYQICKLFIEYTHKGDIDIYTLVGEMSTKEQVTFYAHGLKSVIDFVFDSIIAELNVAPYKVVDVDYIISSALS